MRRSVTHLTSLIPGVSRAVPLSHATRAFADDKSSDQADQATSTSSQAPGIQPVGRLLDLFAPGNIMDAEPTASQSMSPPALGKLGRGSGDAGTSSAEHHDQRDVVRIMVEAVKNVAPMMKVQTIRSGTRVVHVPKVVMPAEQRSLAVR